MVVHYYPIPRVDSLVDKEAHPTGPFIGGLSYQDMKTSFECLCVGGRFSCKGVGFGLLDGQDVHIADLFLTEVSHYSVSRLLAVGLQYA